MITKYETGSALVWSLFFIFFSSVMLVSLTSIADSQLRGILISEDSQIAEYAAEAAAKVGISKAKNLYDSEFFKSNTNQVYSQKIKLNKDIDTSYQVNYRAKDSIMEIIGSAKYKRILFKAKAILSYEAKLTENNFKFSIKHGMQKEYPWKVEQSKNGIVSLIPQTELLENNPSAPTSSYSGPFVLSCGYVDGYAKGAASYQAVLDQPCETNDLTEKDNTFSCVLPVEYSADGLGYALFYGLKSNDPNNMTGYMIQCAGYGSGLALDYLEKNGFAQHPAFKEKYELLKKRLIFPRIFIKKIKATKNFIPKTIGELSWDDRQGDYYRNLGIPDWTPLQQAEGVISITLSEVATKIAAATGENFVATNRHDISISVQYENNEFRHIIKCNGVPILSFVDKSKSAPKTFKSTYNGFALTGDALFWSKPLESYLGFQYLPTSSEELKWLKGERSLIKK